MSEGFPADRLQLDARGAAPARRAAALRRPDLDPTIPHLVALRASQINGCAFCIDMHWLDARADGEEEARLYGLDAWRENPRYNERERAALALCEAVTRIRPGGVPDAVWAEAASHFDETELAQLLCAIAATNAWNRLQITTRALPGHYRPVTREAPERAGSGAGDAAATGAGDAAGTAAGGDAR